MLCLEELLGMLRERLDEHNENRVEVQNKLDEMCAKIMGMQTRWRTELGMKSPQGTRTTKSRSSVSSRSSTKVEGKKEEPG